MKYSKKKKKKKEREREKKCKDTIYRYFPSHLLLVSSCIARIPNRQGCKVSTLTFGVGYTSRLVDKGSTENAEECELESETAGLFDGALFALLTMLFCSLTG